MSDLTDSYNARHEEDVAQQKQFDDNDRIKLAEAMCPDKKWCVGYPLGFIDSDNEKHHLAPDPFTDANDCEALIRFLNEQSFTVDMSIGIENADWVEIWPLADGKPGTQYWDGDDWKQGVCELALKVLDV